VGKLNNIRSRKLNEDESKHNFFLSQKPIIFIHNFFEKSKSKFDEYFEEGKELPKNLEVTDFFEAIY